MTKQLSLIMQISMNDKEFSFRTPISVVSREGVLSAKIQMVYKLLDFGQALLPIKAYDYYDNSVIYIQWEEDAPKYDRYTLNTEKEVDFLLEEFMNAMVEQDYGIYYSWKLFSDLPIDNEEDTV